MYQLNSDFQIQQTYNPLAFQINYSPTIRKIHKQHYSTQITKYENSQSAQSRFNKNKYTRKGFMVKNKKGQHKNMEQDYFQKVWKKYRVNKLKINFIQKLKRGVVLTKSVSLDDKTQTNLGLFEKYLSNIEGIEINNIFITIFQTVITVLLIWLSIIFSIALVFTEIQQSTILKNSQIISLLFLILDIILSCFVKIYQKGKIMDEVIDIMKFYLKRKFPIDFFFVLLLLVDLLTNIKFINFIRMLIIFRFFHYSRKIQKIQNFICTNVRREQQWGLFLVFLFNFAFAHILSLCLNQMALINQDNNWWTSHKIENQQWYVRYIFGYYWGVNIMLTVGFGDYCATNWQEALALIFIEMISCITLAYNINCVGNLISNLRLQDQEKNKNIKLLRRIFKEIPYKTVQISQLQTNTNRYIEKVFQMEKNSGFSYQKQISQILPEKLTNDFIRTVHLQSLNKLFFIKDLTIKTIEMIAFKIQKKIAHPEQMIIKKGDSPKLYFIQKGQLALVVSRNIRGKRDTIIIQKIVSEYDNEKLISFKNLVQNSTQKCDILSLNQSIIYSLQNEDFLEILRQNKIDLEKYFFLKYKDNDIQNDIKCEFCKNMFHSKFQCPRLHYQPIRELIRLKNKKKIIENIQVRNYQLRKKQRKRFVNFQSILTRKNSQSQLPSQKEFNLESYQTRQEVIDVNKVKNNVEIEIEFDKMYNWTIFFPNNNIKSIRLKKMKYQKMKSC